MHIPVRYQVTNLLTKPIFDSSFPSNQSKLMVVLNPTISLRGDIRHYKDHTVEGKEIRLMINTK